MRAAVSHFVVGIIMGMADLVPGVSGGTIAFVSGRYERLIAAIRAVDVRAAQMVLRRRWRALWRHADLGLLVPLLAGIGVAVVSFSGLLDGWLGDVVARPRLFAFFLGLVAASAALVARSLTWNPRLFGMSALGALVGVGLAFSAPARTPETAVWAFVGGALAICAMILPGISGSFILLLAGQYERAVSAVHDRDLGTVGMFGLGAVVGLLLFVRLLRRMLDKHHDPTIAVLVGFIVGSMPRLWPWTACIDCATFQPITPGGGVGLAVLLAVAGAMAIGLFERWARVASSGEVSVPAD